MTRSPADIAMARLNRLRDIWRAADQIAETYGLIDDGIAAGRAWAAWLEAFLPAPQAGEMGR